MSPNCLFRSAFGQNQQETNIKDKNKIYFWKYVQFSAGCGMNEAENVFLAHGWESEYKCMGGSQVTWLVQRSVFVLPSAVA